MGSIVTWPRLRRVTVLLLALSAAGCSHTAPSAAQGERTPGPVKLRVSASARLNPDERGESLPAAVRLYQLKGTAKIRAVELGTLLRDSKEALGEELVSFDEVFVDPGGSGEKTVEIEKGARAVAVVAVFRRPSGEWWRDVVELPRGGESLALEYVLEEYRMSRRP